MITKVSGLEKKSITSFILDFVKIVIFCAKAPPPGLLEHFVDFSNS